MEKILYVGFKGKNNSSYQLVNGLRGEKCFLTNSFSGLERDIDAIEGSFDEVYMFGMDKGLKNTVRIETCAQYERDIIRTGADISRFAKKLEAHGIAYAVSDRPTRYLCNDAYYHMLRRMDHQVLFIHIPSSRNFSEDMKQRLLRAFDDEKEPSFS